MKLKSALKRGREMILALHRLIHTKDYWLRNKDTINNNLTTNKPPKYRHFRSIVKNKVNLFGRAFHYRTLLPRDRKRLFGSRVVYLVAIKPRRWGVI